ncbi:hypothetical protein HPB51_011213 [Rhipicephalus microplus]|uniref:CCHC-type domain-containing protein n=1 Tax=Rhipicephalus microplus TaxID=6941 RepID=A0A9J6F2K1_RHIMP|nr:hypothetical protein HPB51_011213 [Rhipicephalus microplus]
MTTRFPASQYDRRSQRIPPRHPTSRYDAPDQYIRHTRANDDALFIDERPTFRPRLVCYYCGVPGHISRFCNRREAFEWEIAAYLQNYGRYTDQGKVRVMFPDGLTALQKIIGKNSKDLMLVEKNKRRLEWLRVAARLALASGSEPAASAAVTLMTGVLGKAHSERRCMTLFDTEVRPFAFDRVRAMVHTDETPARVKKLDAQFREYARKLADNATFGGTPLQKRIQTRVDSITVLYMYPFSDYTDSEVGQYPLTRLVYTPVTMPLTASFWEQLRLVKEAIFDVGMRDSFDNTNLSWVHFSPLAREPFFAWEIGAIYIPPLFYERIRTMTDVKDDEGIPLDLPLFWWAVLRQFATILSQRGCLYEKNGQHRDTLGFDTDNAWSISRPCIDLVLSNLGASAGAEEYDYLHAEPYVLKFLHNLYVTKAEIWKKKVKPDAEKVLLHDHPDLTLDKLFAIAFASVDSKDVVKILLHMKALRSKRGRYKAAMSDTATTTTTRMDEIFFNGAG